MLTKYGKIAVQFTNASQYPLFQPNPSTEKGVISFKDNLGADQFFSMFVKGISDNPVTSNNDYGVVFGTGNTPATENDYSLESKISSNVTLSKGSNRIYRWDFENKKFYIGMDYTIANRGSESLEITEIGKVVSAYTSSALNENASGNEHRVLLDRTVLESPVIIPAGQSGVVRYEFEYNFSTTVE